MKFFSKKAPFSELKLKDTS